MTSDRLISAATQIQRWRDFLSQVTAYVVGNLLLIGIWAVSGRGTFGPSDRCWSGGLGCLFSTSTRSCGVRSLQNRQRRTFPATPLELGLPGLECGG
jgi:hypothetical protein